MRLRPLAPGPLAGLVLWTVGCGGPEFFASGTEGDGGPGADATAIDASTPADAIAPPPKDGSPDSGDADDGAAVSSDGGDASFSCAAQGPTVVFCSDFDDAGAAPPWNWTLTLQTAKGKSALDPVDFRSSPYGYAATTQTLLVTDTATFASLQKSFPSFPSTPSRIEYSFHVLVKQFDATGTASFPFARLVANAATSSALFLDLALDKNGLTLIQSGPASDGGTISERDPVGGSLGTNVWTHVDMLLDRAAVPWTITVRLNGALGLGAHATVASPAGSGLEVDLGIVDVVPLSGPNALTFDSVTVRAY